MSNCKTQDWENCRGKSRCRIWCGNSACISHSAPQPVKPAEQEPVEWRDVAGFKSYYEVSSNGDLRSKKTGRIMAKSLTGAGYVKAALWADGQRKQTTVHRLVAEAFRGPAEGREVNHKNGNKQDNRVSNLEWRSRSDNKHEVAVIEVMRELHQQQQADEALLRQALEAMEQAHDESLDEDHFECRSILRGQIAILRKRLGETK